MDLIAVLDQVRELLQTKGRLTYRLLQAQFQLDNDALAALKEELIEGEQVARDEKGKVLVWTGTLTEPPVNSAEQRKKKAPPPPSTMHRAPEAERRHLTVMFCDLVGSTPLAEQLDPEELRQVILTYQQTCAEQIQRFDGYLARYIGDGLLVYFGYPQAHEDDAQRAIRAGLGIVAALPPLNTRLQQTVKVLRGTPLRVRIGIHTGLVVVGDMGGGDYRDPMAIVGETPNIAARVQSIAEPNTVVISEATARLVQGLFECHACGPQALKGVSTPVPVYRVLRESAAQSRFEVAVRTGLTPLIGREHEVGLLQERWAAAQAGEGQVVLLSGEPGIGKSRLVQEVKEWVVQQGATYLEFRCSPYAQQSTLSPVLAHLERLLQWQREDTPQEKLEKLRQTLARYHFPQAETLPLLAALLSLAHPAETPPLNFSPQKQKQKTQEALVAWLVEEAERAPVYCVWEDLHWADPSTVELLGLLLDQVPTTRLLMLLTARPEFTPPWGSRTHVTPLSLARLPRPQAAEMIAKVTGGKPVPAEVQQQIVSKTDGVPLFVEELTKMVLESGLLQETNGCYALSGPLPPLAIPATLQDSLMARLDRLAAAKEVAQLGATLGREFSYELIRMLSPVAEPNLQQALAQLIDAEVLYQRGLPPHARYLFKHALIQDAAYQSLLKRTRHQYHQHIAQVLVERFPETVQTQPELVAHHYTEAGLIEHAVPYWQLAGERANQRSAPTEAVGHVTKGIALLKTLAETPEHRKQELTLQLALGEALAAVKGYAAPEVETAVTRARALCQQLGETPQLSSMLYRLSLFYMIRGEVQLAHELGQQMLRLAQSLHEQPLLAQAHTRLGWILSARGEWSAARPHLAEAMALCDPQHQPRCSSKAYYPQVECLSYTAGALWYLGYPDQALQQSREAVAVAEGLARPHLLAYALGHAAMCHLDRREEHRARERAEATIAVASEQGFPYWVAWGRMVRGWALAEQGQDEDGIAQMRQGLAAYQATGAGVRVPYFLALLAAAYGKVGQEEEGGTVLSEALARAHKSGERHYEAELYRLKGMLRLESPVPGLHSTVAQEAEACFRAAIESARRQSAKLLELRAVMSLSRLWQRQGKREEARQLLVDIYGWFTEGFDTKDLREAKALLNELTA